MPEVLLFPIYRRRSRHGLELRKYDIVGWVGFKSPTSTPTAARATWRDRSCRWSGMGIRSKSGDEHELRRSRHPARRITTKKEGRKETLMTYRVKNITIAVALALVAALLTSFYVTNYQRNVRKDETERADLGRRRATSRPARPAPTSSGRGCSRRARSSAAASSRARSRIPTRSPSSSPRSRSYAGEQVSTRRFSTPSQRGIKAQLTGVQRAIEIAGDQHQLLVGTLKAGDKVDVVATLRRRRQRALAHADRPPRHRGAPRARRAVGRGEKITSASDRAAPSP